MHRTTGLGLTFLLFVPTAAAQDWPTFTNETALRMPTGPGLNDPQFTTTDDQAKNYAWGDVDQDGDIDLVCVRKQPHNDAGRRRNVLFMNEGIADGHPVNGVLVDRTAQYASDADDGGNGFLDLTADRDVVLLDVNGDTWLDMITTTTYGQGQPKTISHPRVYLNSAELAGNWQGFRYEESRTPTMPIAPNFCGIGFGDITGDGLPDLYHTDYNNALEDRLWINDGSGSFSDESTLRMSFEMRESEFGVHAFIADMNGDGLNDIVKDRANGAPYRITISYNDPNNEGFFDAFETVYTGAPYYVLVEDLNNDSLPDIVLQDDGIDRFLLNIGNGPDGLADFVGTALPSQSNGFEGVIELADLNNDGHIDLLVADETVNGVGALCSREMLIWRNSGNLPAGNFIDQSAASIPLTARRGTWDVAPFDLNGDQWADLVIGTCDGTTVWMSQPPVGINFGYPDGVPAISDPAGSQFAVQIEAFGDDLDPAHPPRLHASIDGGMFVESELIPSGGGQYTATLPPGDCLDSMAFYLSAQLVGGLIISDPPSAPANTHVASIAGDVLLIFADDMENDVSGWSVTSAPGLTSGTWERVDPNGTLQGGSLAAPADDATPDPGIMAFVTENGPPGGAAGANDVDGGSTTLTSPAFDIQGLDARISYAAWLYTLFSTPDPLRVEITNNNGDTWVAVEMIDDTASAWLQSSFVVGDYVTPTDQVRVRFIAEDPDASITEAGIDEFRVERLDCLGGCPLDLNDDHDINAADLALLLGAWGANPGHPADLNADGTINAADLALLLGGWGPC